jgi:hypothetical protein
MKLGRLPHHQASPVEEALEGKPARCGVVVSPDKPETRGSGRVILGTVVPLAPLGQGDHLRAHGSTSC